MAKKQSLSLRIVLTGDALTIVKDEKKKYEKKKIIRGKNKIVNLLLSELQQARIELIVLRNKK